MRGRADSKCGRLCDYRGKRRGGSFYTLYK